MFFKRKRSAEAPQTGAVYIRSEDGRAVERAEVIDIAPDGMGIPHVRYRATCYCRDRQEPAGFRILALSCFHDRFEPSESLS